MKTIYILIGLKGSGKTYIGHLLFERLAIPFLRVEDIFLKIKTENPLEDQNYITSGFKNVEIAIRVHLAKYNKVTIESTGIANQFNEMVSSLKHDYFVKLIKIEADPNLCLDRIKCRDKSKHISVSDNYINLINKQALSLSLKFDLTLNNDSSTDNELVNKFIELL